MQCLEKAYKKIWNKGKIKVQFLYTLNLPIYKAFLPNKWHTFIVLHRSIINPNWVCLYFIILDAWIFIYKHNWYKFEWYLVWNWSAHSTKKEIWAHLKSKDIWHQIIVNLKNTLYKIGMQLESNLDYWASFLIYYTYMIWNRIICM